MNHPYDSCNKTYSDTATVCKKARLVAFYFDSVQMLVEENELVHCCHQGLTWIGLKDKVVQPLRYIGPSIWLPASRIPAMVFAKVDRQQLQTMTNGL